VPNFERMRKLAGLMNVRREQRAASTSNLPER